MALSFNDLKKNAANDTKRLAEEIAKSKQSAYPEDKRIWYPSVDKTGNGFAIIRFLPAPKGEDHPYVRLWSHGFKGPTGLWYVENSLTTLGQQDPVSEYNNMLWNKDNDKDSIFKKQARDQKRNLTYVANILIIKDGNNPENEGQVKLFRFGPKIYDKLADVMNPKFEDEKPMNPFDFWKGADFKLKIRTVEGYRNYDKSEFDSPSELFDNDEEKLSKLWESQHSLAAFIAADQFKPYDKLKARLDIVLGLADGKATPGVKDVVADEKPAVKEKAAVKAPEKEAASTTDADDDEDLAYYKNLASK